MPFDPKKYTLLDAATGTVSSSWYEIWPYEDVVLHFYGLETGDSVVVEASLEDGDPSNHVQWGTTISDADDMVVLNELPEKIRVRISDNSGGGSITVIMHGRIPK